MKMKLFNLVMIALFCCAQLKSFAKETTSSSEIVKKQVIAMSQINDDDIYETVRDYIYALSKEPGTPESKLQAIADLKYSPAKPGWSPIPKLSDATPILKDCHVRSVSDLILMQRALAALDGECTVAQGPILYRIGLEAEQVTVSNAVDRRVKGETICQVERALVNDKEYGKKFGLITLKQIATDSTVPTKTKGIAVTQILYSYLQGFSPKDGEGKLFAETLHYALIIMEQDPEPVIGWLDQFFPELAKRCDADTTAQLQGEIVELAVKLKVQESTLSLLRAQLGYAYLLADRYVLAESALRQSAKDVRSMPLIVRTLLAQCLSLEGKLDESNLVIEQIENTSQHWTEQHADVYAAIAKAIHAQNLISLGNTELALKLLQESDQTLFRRMGQLDPDHVRFPFYENAYPTANSVLLAEIALYKKLDRLAEAEQTQEKLNKIEFEHKKFLVSDEEARLLNSAELFNSTDLQIPDERLLTYAKRYIELCTKSPQSVSKLREKILTYAEKLIASGELKCAEFCLDECAKAKNRTKDDHRITNDRIEIAELKGESEAAKSLLDDETKLTDVNQDDLLRTSELLATLSLMNGEYDQSEKQSRSLQTQLFSLNDEPKDNNASLQDEFAGKYSVGLLDRAQALSHQKSFKEALVLLRRLLKFPCGSYVLIDASALMARCYQNTGHTGLALAAAQQTVDLLHSIVNNEQGQTRLLADANFQMGQVALANGNKIRAQRYFSEALKIGRDSHLIETALHKEIELANQF